MDLKQAMFRPEELKLLRQVLDDAAAAMPPAFRTSEVKSRLAERILKAAAAGERDPSQLRVAALLDFDVRPERWRDPESLNRTLPAA